MVKKELTSKIIVISLFLLTKFSLFAQIDPIQLNLLLDKGQALRWVKNYQVYFHGQIPAQILLGQIDSSNVVLGLMHVGKIPTNLILRGVIQSDTVTMVEWFKDNESGRVEVSISNGRLNGYWYNMNRTIQIPISSDKSTKENSSYFRQYEGEKGYFSTQITASNELILDNAYVKEVDWMDREMDGSCAILSTGKEKSKFCYSDILVTYPFVDLDLIRIMWGEIPQIPHDAVFNSRISTQIEKWRSEIFEEEVDLWAKTRWHNHHLIWFTPDYISEKVISGMLSIQYMGKKVLHSFAFIYDKENRKFLDQSNFFRSNTPWVEIFQIKARSVFESQHSDLVKLFPTAFEKIRFHLTLTPKGLLLSSDFNSFFGRITYGLRREDIEVYVQRFAPFRGNLYFD